jgi:membrane-bound serine protease (ClpP class)
MSLRRTIRALAAALILAGTIGTTAGAQPVTPDGSILAVRLDGVVDGFSADYLTEAVRDAEAEARPALLVEIDTPGGLSDAMDQITTSFLNARVPVICYVAPSGTRAASAGAIILLSCPVAAMAPATNVGASTPIGLDGGDLSQKIRNDAEAKARSYAQTYGRNDEVAATFVSQAASLTAEEALEANVIDLIATSRDELFAALDGTTVTLGTGQEVTLALAGVPVEERGIGGFVGFLHRLFDPSLAFLFFWLGLALLVLELIIPGHVFSGTVGTILLGISVWSLLLLPVQLVGVVLLIASVVCFIIELKAPGIGIWGGVGLLTLVLGGWFLYDRTGGVEVSPWILVITAGIVAVFFGLVVAKAMRMRHMPPPLGPRAVIGKDGVALGGGVDERGGAVRVAAEEWRAVSPSGLIPGGASVHVTDLDGLVLTVEPSQTEHLPVASGAGTEEGA